MVFSSTHTRLTRTSSDLRILAGVLLPPSPILEADNFLVSSTSGEIPILLQATTHVCDSPLYNYGELPGLRGGTEESRDMCSTTMQPPNGRCLGLVAESRSDSECPSETDVGELKGSMCNDYSGIDGKCSRVRGDWAESPVFGKQDDAEGLRDSQALCPNTMELSATSQVAPGEALEGNQLVTFATFSTLPTPIFAPPSPSPSADMLLPLSPSISRHYRRPLERARAVRFPGRPRSIRLQVNEDGTDPACNAPPSSTDSASHSRRQITNSQAPAVTSHSHAADAHFLDAVHPSVKHIALPEELSWIKHMAIELWIDQEGFRAVKSSMKLIGYSPRSRSLHPYESGENARPDDTAGVAEFMPTKRETFAFHYASLDSPPTLRMVSVVGDEARDYISRQATLSVKTNGVYTVIGTEAFIAPSLNNDAHVGSRLQNVRLRWKFDYLVSDRKVDGAGKTLPGEKTLTPLTFSCSPYLLHQSQGKKTGLMYIMKKNLSPKLASQKVEPPTYASHQGIHPQATRHLLFGRETAIHARSRSDALFAKSGRYPVMRSVLDAEVRGTMEGVNHITRVRRRRASSAGENSLAGSRNEPRRGGLKEGVVIPSPVLRLF